MSASKGPSIDAKFGFSASHHHLFNSQDLLNICPGRITWSTQVSQDISFESIWDKTVWCDMGDLFVLHMSSHSSQHHLGQSVHPDLQRPPHHSRGSVYAQPLFIPAPVQPILMNAPLAHGTWLTSHYPCWPCVPSTVSPFLHGPSSVSAPWGRGFPHHI